LVPIWNRG